MKKINLLFAVLALFAVFAGPAAAQRTRPERNRIRAEEIRQSDATNVYQLIQARRNAWLSRRHNVDVNEERNEIVVFLDNAQLSGVDELQQVPVANVQMVEFLTAGESEFRLGRSSPNGAIVVTTTKVPAEPAHP
jgi:hypothetical protein